jgi:hypothetical protein
VTGFVIAVVIVAYLAFGWGLIWAAAVDKLPGWACVLGLRVGAGYMGGGLGGFIQAGLNAQASGPCLRYETIMQYNPNTKTVMPARHCVERAEWAE